MTTIAITIGSLRILVPETVYYTAYNYFIPN